MSSRLDRLFLLLENGGSGVTRKAAALQLGEVVRLHPHELHTLLDRLHLYIVSKSWETRIAAGQAVEGIISNMPKWDPQPLKVEKELELYPDHDLKSSSYSVGQLSIRSFNIKKVLEHGSYLLGADEKQFELDEENAKVDPKELAARQRLLVNQRLGLDIAEAMGMDTQSIFSNLDLTNVPEVQKTIVSKESVVQIVQSEMVSAGMRMSSREINRAKRKAKFINKQKSNDSADKYSEEGQERKRVKLNSQESSLSDEEENNLTIAEDTVIIDQDTEWPLEEFAEHLSRDLFSCSWETRHGAATSLREVIRLHGSGAGKTAYQTLEQMENNHRNWLEDKAVRLVCILALDRFGDFLADQVVAPVRETCAQVLGCIVQHLPNEIVLDILSLLQEMLLWHDWGTRHGGLLGLKYLLAVKSDLRKQLLIQSYSYIYKGLQDEMDDVVAVAATCLVPVAEELVENVSVATINCLLGTLWEALLDIDDLTASTNSVLLLISKLLSYRNILRNFDGDLNMLIPRLWPFLYHSSSPIRVSALKTIETIAESEALQLCENGSPVYIEEGKLEEMKIDVIRIDDIESTKKIREGNWMENILEPLLVHIYQRSLIECNRENTKYIIKIWNNILKKVSIGNLLLISCRLMPSWLCLMMTNPKVPLDANLLLLAPHCKSSDGHKKTQRLSELGEGDNNIDTKFYIGGSRTPVSGDRNDQVIHARCTAAKLLGNLSHYVSQPMPGIEYQPDETPILCYVRLLIAHINSRSSMQRFGCGLVIREWAIQHPETLCHSLLKANLLSCLTDVVYYDEIAWSFTRLQQESKDFIAMMRHYKSDLDPSWSTSSILSLEQIQSLCDSATLRCAKLRKKVQETLIARSIAILSSVNQISAEQSKLTTIIQAVIAGAIVRFKSLPEKLNPVIKPLMESIKKEANEEQQKMAALDLTCLLDQCVDRQPSPNAKVLKNLSSFLCVDEDFTPNLINNCSQKSLVEGILTLSVQLKAANLKLYRRTSSSGSRGPGRPPSKPTPSTSTDACLELPECTEVKRQNEIQRRGCIIALTSIVCHFGSELEVKQPYFTNMIFDNLTNCSSQDISMDAAQTVINWLQLLEVLIPSLHTNVLQKFELHLDVFDTWLYHPFSAVRHMAGRVVSTLSAVSTQKVMAHIIKNVLPSFNDMTSDNKRQGTVECIYLTIEKLGFRIVNYIVLLIVPLLGRVSDPKECVRLLATQCFATLIRLFPLDGGMLSPLPDISTELFEQITKERLFLDRLLDPKKIESYQVPVPINAELRSYQQKGVNWLGFLNEYNLHGILCDDMGLGKTLQSICILAGDHFKKESLKKESIQDFSTGFRGKCKVQSLVVCPPTLTGHWYYEILKFVSPEYLNPLHYTGPPIERKRLRNYFLNHNLIIASYKIVRNEIDFFSQTKWNYIILDEGHIIKNGKTKSSKAIKELTGNHRLILTGTPIQNNVLELWSLFDFLMPGFLGTERQFMSKYSRPILQSRESKSSPKEQEAGVLAMESLHRQVLPFLLRRVKEDVLKDLPPKITQDYYCDLSPLQEKLYEDFAKSRACQNIDESLGGEDKGKSHGHIFQALQYLRRVCNHPKLALLPNHPQYEVITKQIKESKSPLTDISHSAKLPALKQLLLDCGIGSSDEETVDSTLSQNSVVSPHRALIFCQLKAMLDIIEKDLLKVHLPSVTYLRLDGSVPAGSRHSLVHRFNTDPSIDLLLLTTQVGGLGLNLTGADTVIFVEHDWNPMRDLQAMDRAHRIGQKRVVNVYRLITKGTLEEKIMSLQKFKLMTANSVISQENSSLLSMGTNQLLDLFTLDSKGDNSRTQTSASSSNGNDCLTLGLQGTGAKGVIENLPELWDESLYENEYNLDSFMNSLK